MGRDLNPRQKVKAADPSSSSSPSQRPSFDVFLSFRGKDTRKGFTGHLYKALHQRGIHTFIDNENLEIGERIDELFSYIERSKIFVPVLSEGYADSTWCLREITKMVECQRLIVPIFFHVEPTHVRKQSGPFEAAFKWHDEKGEEDLSKWKEALREVGEMSGYSLQNDTNGNEAELIQKVVEQISRKLSETAPRSEPHLPGMDSHIDKMNSLLDPIDNGVKMIGIVGLGGIGKTTIAKTIYNMLRLDFEGSSLILDIREGFKLYNGPAALQQKLIRDVLKDKDTDVNDIEHGASLIESRFRSKKVLIVLDDADRIEQLETLARERDWFGSGSRIIITSRDAKVLSNHGIKEQDIYRPNPLNDKNSYELFYSCAFRGVPPTNNEFRVLSAKVVEQTGGLPSALKAFGSLLCGRNIEQWKEIVEGSACDPNEDIQRTLRISYDALDENVQEIFLDISCFLIGKQMVDATYMWEACGLCPETAISKLQERSLININKYDEFEMHDLVRDVGRNIAQQGVCRLWNSDGSLNTSHYKVSPLQAELKMAKGISFWGYSKTHLSTEDFVDFSHLRLLHLTWIELKGEFMRLPPKLKWLSLFGCRFPNRLSGASNLNGISVLELIHVDDVARVLIEQSSSSREAFDALKVLRMGSSVMTKTPDFSKMKMICLRKLTLQNCMMLAEVDGSIGSLKSLVYLNLRGCSKLQQLPDTICGLNSLETLVLSRCSRLSCLPEKLGDMTSLRELHADWTSIRAIPDSIDNLSNLRTLSLWEIDGLEKLPDSVGMLDSLQELYMTNFAGYDLEGITFFDIDYRPNLMKIDSLCFEQGESAEWLAVIPNSLCYKVKKLEVEDFGMQGLPPYFGRLMNLESLCLKCLDLRALPEWLGQLQKLKSFELESHQIISIGEGFSLASSVDELSINSSSLEALPATAGRLNNLKSLKLNCPKLGCVTDWIMSVASFGVQPISYAALALSTSLVDHRCLLRTLNLSHTDIWYLPSSMSNLTQLQELHLENCQNLESLPPLPTSLRVLNAPGCNNLRTISDISNLKSLRELKLGCCTLLQDFWGLESIAHNLETLELPGPCGSFPEFSQLTPAFFSRIFKEVAFSSLKTFRVSGKNPEEETLESESGEVPELELVSGEEPEEETLDLESGDEPGEETLDLESGEESGDETLDLEAGEKSGEEAVDLESGEESGEETLDLESGEEHGDETLDLECSPTHFDFWTTFPKVGRGEKRPTRVVWSSSLGEDWNSKPDSKEFSISIVEEDGNVIYPPTGVYCRMRDPTLHLLHWYQDIGGEAIGEYSREGNYLRMQLRAPVPMCYLSSRSLDLYVHYT